MTLGLLVTFLGIGAIVNGLIVYIVALSVGERSQNRHVTPGDETAV
jgi:hypothetical protein